MTPNADTSQIRIPDQRRRLMIPGDRDATLAYCVEHFVACATEAVDLRGVFTVALSGGSTPRALFGLLADPLNAKKVDWSKVLLFWSDERSVQPHHPESNYGSALAAGMGSLPIPPNHIFRMRAEEQIQANSAAYEQTIRDCVEDGVFDLITLGMGDDGHTASLFPGTAALDEQTRLVVGNDVPGKGARMTFTYPLINQARHIVVYVLGSGKAPMLETVMKPSCTLPAARVGTETHPALWIADNDAAALVR